MVMGYEVSEDGTLTPVEIDRSSLDSTRVLCVVDDATKSIYLWKGSQANIRAKFVGARVATNLRTEYGFHFKVKPVEEGEEPPTFFSALDGTTAATPIYRPGQASAARPQPHAAPATPSTVSDEHAAAPATTPKTTTSSPPPPPPPTSVQPQETTTETVKTQPTTATAKTTPPPPPPPVTSQPAVTTKTVAAPATTSSRAVASATTAAAQATPGDIPPHIKEMIDELETIEPPEGYQRELLIIYNELFTIAERRFKVFGQERVERKFERVKEPPEGTFMAEGFIPRVIVKDGKILAIELLKGTPDAILSPIKAEMRERLSDLISFFKSETEEEGEEHDSEEDGSKKAGRRRLVAK